MRRHYSIHGFRRQWASSSAWNDVAAYLAGTQAAVLTPTAGTTYYIVSTSAQDATGGSGVDKVRIVYLNATGHLATKEVTLNGLTAVSVGNDISFVQWMESWHSTTGQRVAAGDISITSTNGAAAETTTVERIRSGGNKSQSGRFKVPTGTHAHLVDYHAGAVKTSGGSAQYDVELRATIFNDDNSLSNAFHFVRGTYVQDGNNFSDDLHDKEIPAGAIIKLSVIPTSVADGNIFKCIVDVIVVDDYS